ncbi:unnamed protein product, partial [Candidula unifasciata]
MHTYRTVGKCEMKSVYIQVTELEIEDAYGNKPMPVWGTNGGQSSGELSIAECLKAAAEAELQNQLKDVTTYSTSESGEIKPEVASGYVFDESSGLYYHSATGYYWDPNSGLFYDYTTKAYYKYNEATGGYEVYSQAEVSRQMQIPDSENKELYTDKSSIPYNIDIISSRFSQMKIDLQSCNICQVMSPTHFFLFSFQTKNKRHKKHRSRTKEGESSDNSSQKLKKHIKSSPDKIDSNVSAENMDKSSTVLMTKQQESVDVEDLVEEECSADKMLAEEDIEHNSESSHSCTSSDSESSSESGELTAESSSSDVEMIEIEHPPVAYESITEMAEEYPPCIRVIVQSSDHLKCGSLYIITCTGGYVGREKNKGLAIQIDDLSVSKLHAEIAFDYEEHCYTLRDKGSQNGTVLNGVKLSQ